MNLVDVKCLVRLNDKGDLCCAPQIVQGELRFNFDWGSGPGEARLAEQVNDGSWHSLVLDLRGNTVHLVLDGQHEASGKAPGALNTLSLDSSVFLGAQVCWSCCTVPVLHTQTFWIIPCYALCSICRCSSHQMGSG